MTCPAASYTCTETNEAPSSDWNRRSKPTAETGCAKLSLMSSFSTGGLGPGASCAPPGERTFSPPVGSSLLVEGLGALEKPDGVKVSAPRTTTSGALGAGRSPLSKRTPEMVWPETSVPGATSSKLTATAGEPAAALNFARSPTKAVGALRNETVWSGPALTDGAPLPGMTVTTTVSALVCPESVAVRRSV